MPKPAAQIDRWIREQQARLGIPSDEGLVPTLTVYPSLYVIERLAHAAADERIAADPVYDAMCARLDAELAEILSGTSARAPSLPKVLTID